MVVREHPVLSLSRQCRLLSIGRSSLYYEPKGESAETLALMRRIDELFLKYPFYGARRMVLHLRREGVRIGRRRAARLMRLMGLEAIYRAPRTSEPQPEHRVWPYLLRGLAIERADHVWCADITYIPVSRGFLYLVAIMDWASRYVLAWRLSNTLDAGFCTDALDEALARYGTPEIFNTDQGRSYEAKLRLALRCRRSRSLIRRHEMPPRNETVTPAGAEDNTLYVAIEISRKSWVVGVKSPASERIGLHSLGAADVEGVRDLIDRQRTKAARALGRELDVLCCYEAGYEGFWLARWLDRTMSVETVVLDPASLLVNRKAKQRKTDRIDAKKMVRALLAFDRGDAAVLSRVRVPSVEEGDSKRLLRERRRLVKERTSLTNSIKGLLKHGIFDLQPRSNGFRAMFAKVRTAYGSPFPTRARQEVLRLAERLALVERQIAQVEAERDRVVRSGAQLSAADLPEGVDAQAAAKIATLTRLKGIGANDATLLTHEIFYRDFRNRRELASWVGMTPTPWASGDMQRDQGIGRDGPGWIRAQLIQMAWRWLRHQPDSTLCKWFEERTAGGRGRIRRVMIVALARKLLIALWRFYGTGLVPAGAKLA
jgi:transposase